MKIAVVIRQLPDLIEPLEIDSTGKALDLEEARFLVNEYDDHAVEQALLLKEEAGGEVIVVALDYGDVDQTLFSASAKGVDRILKIPCDEEISPAPSQAAKLYAAVLKELNPDLIMLGMQAFDELEGNLCPLLSMEMNLPYVGVIKGVEKGGDESSIKVFKEYPGAAMARLAVKLPAVLGILTANQPPRYVPISRIRAVMKSAQFEETDAAMPAHQPIVQLNTMSIPEMGEGAEMWEGSEEDIAGKILHVLEEKGVLK